MRCERYEVISFSVKRMVWGDQWLVVPSAFHWVSDSSHIFDCYELLLPHMNGKQLDMNSEGNKDTTLPTM